MRLHRLEIEGFGPFRDRQTVDFDAFADDGIFLIGGRTGAGKSSILDAVCFGLYGGVPRYDGGERRLRSDHCAPGDPTEVVVEFSTAAGRFRVTRSPDYERPSKRGGGTTKQAASALLEEWRGGVWVGRGARAVDVAQELDTILQLTLAQFLQVILLAQNRFAEFLHASSKDRQTLLRRLFGSERFGDYQARFDERRRLSEQALGHGLAAVTARIEEGERLVAEHGLGASEAPTGETHSGESDAGATTAESGSADSSGTTAERIVDLRRALDRAAYRAERRRAESEGAESALRVAEALRDEAREKRKAQAERDRARQALADLDAQAQAVDEERRSLERARAAESLRALLLAARRAQEEADAAETALAAAWEEWSTGDRSAGESSVGGERPGGRSTEAGNTREEGGQRRAVESGASAEGMTGQTAAAPEPDPEDSGALREWVSARLRDTGAWERAAALEADAPARESALSTAEAEAEAAGEAVTRLDTERANLPALLDALVTARDTARRLADRAEDRRRLRDEAAATSAAAKEAEERGARRQEAERLLLERSEQAMAAQAHVTALRRRRLTGMAGELAADLVPGDPCAVCGSPVHPAPAVSVDPVSEEDVLAAEREQEACAEAQRLASAQVSALAADLSAALARSAGSSVDAADAALDAAEREYARSTDAVVVLERAEADAADAQARSSALDAERSAASSQADAAREALHIAQRMQREAEVQIALARGVHGTVSERLASVAVRIDTATRLASALDERMQKKEYAARALTEQAEAIASSPFADAPEAEDALRPLSAQAAWEESLAAHTAHRERERAVLLELELRMLPEEEIDPAPSAAVAAVAREAWLDAVDAASRAASTETHLRSLVAAAAEGHASSEERNEEHEVLRALADAVAGRSANTRKMSLETFVLAAELEDIVSAANVRLHDMSSGRYRLEHSDALAARGATSGLGIVVYDSFTGQSRPAQSLSGGETFLGSLALALGLAEVVTARAGGVRLDTLFIDEGFGSLDDEALEAAMRTLDELRQGGRTVGVISHVEAMQQQIPARLTVRATSKGPSVIDAC